MNREMLLRRALWTAAVFNLLGAGLFAFPGSYLAQLVGLPASVPLVYRALTALFVLLFGGAYLWVARQTAIVRPMVVFGAIGKASAFTLFVLLWLCGVVGARGVALASGDVVLAALFLWCLRGGRPMASERS